jgi:hypothetical protein
MAKKRPKRKEAIERKNELAKKNKDEDSGILGTMTSKGKKVNIEKWHITGISIPTTLIAGSDELNEEQKAIFELKSEAVKLALKSKSKDLQDEAIDTMLGDLVAGAYQDKLIVYTRAPSGHSRNSLEALKGIQSVRQAADVHLLRILRAVKEIKQHQPKLTVKEAQQVNVADKQVNVSQKGNS